MEYIIPLKRDNALIPYHLLKEVEQTEGYFEHAKRFIFHAQTSNLSKKLGLLIMKRFSRSKIN